MPHSHSDHDHDHSHDQPAALQSSLYSQIDFDGIVAQNESAPGSAAAVVRKTWEQRRDPAPALLSDADEQLLVVVPFIGQCTLHTLLVASLPSDLSSPAAPPRTIHLFRNQPDLDFATATSLRHRTTQTLHLPHPSTSTSSDSSVLEIPLNRAHWNATTSVTMFVESNHSSSPGDRGEEDEDEEEEDEDNEQKTVITYLGWRGTWMRLNREPVSVLYEAAANPSDHKVIQGLGVAPGQGMEGR